jgi:ATP-dependent exoDNAse (exonuclease V) alpha subunit
MSYVSDDITLQHRHYITLVLRLALDETGHLLEGELVDTTATLHKRFLGVAGLNQAIEAWLRQQEHSVADDASADAQRGGQRGTPPQIPQKGE